MSRHDSAFHRSLLLLPFLALVVLAACTPKTPQQVVEETRAQYKVTLNAFLPQEPAMDESMMEEPMEGEMSENGESMDTPDAMGEDQMAEGETMEGEMAEGEMTEGEMMDDGAAATRNIIFDVLVQFSGTKPLPGLTLDITQADAFEKEKATFRYYLETGPMVKSEAKQMSFTLEDVAFETGDVFSVELRSTVPAAEQGEYREFAEAGQG